MTPYSELHWNSRSDSEWIVWHWLHCIWVCLSGAAENWVLCVCEALCHYPSIPGQVSMCARIFFFKWYFDGGIGWSTLPWSIYPWPTDWTLLRVRGPAAMAGLLARPSPCDWLALRCIHCRRYHCQPTVIGSDGSAQKNIQILAFIICYTLARPDLFD